MPLSAGVKLKWSPWPLETTWPLLATTLQVQDMESAPTSLCEPLRLTSVPSFAVTSSPAKATGFTLSTVTTNWSLDEPPSSSVTVKVTL